MSVAEADDLRAAWALIDAPEKWCKGVSRSRDGRYCMLGAIDWTCPGNSKQVRIKDILRSVLPEQFHWRITRANDFPCTKHDDVRRWFAEAIARAEAGGMSKHTPGPWRHDTHLGCKQVRANKSGSYRQSPWLTEVCSTPGPRAVSRRSAALAELPPHRPAVRGRAARNMEDAIMDAVVICSTCGARALGRPNFWSCRLCDSLGTEAEPMEEPQRIANAPMTPPPEPAP